MVSPSDLGQSPAHQNWRPTVTPGLTLWSQEILAVIPTLAGGGEVPPQLVAIVVPFVRRMRTTLLLRRTRRLRRQDLPPPAPSSHGFHHVPATWIACGTWWTAFDSNIHFDNWQRGFVTGRFGAPVRIYSIQRLTVTTPLRAASSPIRILSGRSATSF